MYFSKCFTFTYLSYNYVNTNIHWKDWCWGWRSSNVATWCKQQTHWKRPWYWERLRAGGEGDDRGWDGWMASLTQWTWVWVNSGSWWWTGRPGVLRFMGSQRVGHDWVTDLNWTEVVIKMVLDTLSILTKLSADFFLNMGLWPLFY